MATYTVFVSVGNSEVPFGRLIAWLRPILEKRGIDSCFIQRGNTPVDDGPWISDTFVSHERCIELIAGAKYVISHGGSGGIFSAARQGKKTICVPRLAAFDEIVNDHQVQTVQYFASAGVVFHVKSADELDAMFDLPNEDLLLEVEVIVPRVFDELDRIAIRVASERR